MNTVWDISLIPPLYKNKTDELLLFIILLFTTTPFHFFSYLFYKMKELNMCETGYIFPRHKLKQNFNTMYDIKHNQTQ